MSVGDPQPNILPVTLASVRLPVESQGGSRDCQCSFMGITWVERREVRCTLAKESGPVSQALRRWQLAQEQKLARLDERSGLPVPRIARDEVTRRRWRRGQAVDVDTTGKRRIRTLPRG